MLNLLPQQTSAVSKLEPWKVGALFMEAGTAKTRIAVELGKASRPDLVIWVGPLRSIKPKDGLPSIIDEVNKWGGFDAETIYTGVESISQSDRTYLQLYNRIRTAWNPMIIIDESLSIKNGTAKRTQRMLELSQMAQLKLILNGTPLSKNLLDLKSQMDFLSPLILNMSDAEYKNTFCEYTRVTKRFGTYKTYTKEFITAYHNIDYLYSLIRHYVFECSLTLQVSQMYSELQYEIDEESLKEYQYLKEKYLDDEMLQWKNNNIFIEMTQKMQHVYCTTPSKFEVLDDYFKSVDESRTIIFCKYVRSREECEKRYPKATVLSYQTGAKSLNLQYLNHTVYFDKTWDYANREHSTHRTFRTGQEYDCRYLDLTGNVGLENLIDKNIKKKISMTEYFKGKTKEQLKEAL